MTNTLTDNRFETLRTSYLEKMEGKIVQLEEEVFRVAYADEDFGENIAQLYGTLHKLVGSAGIYGILNVSKAATHFLDWVRPYKEKPKAFSDNERNQMEVLLQKLKYEICDTLDADPQTISIPRTLSAPILDVPPLNLVTMKPVTKGHVYVVDDDREQAQALEFYLMQAGFDVLWFESITEAEEAVAHTRPAALIMDLMFPEGDLAGAEAVSRLKSDLDKELPVLFLSARKDIEARLAATRAGATHYFTKPVDIGRMIDELNKVTKIKDEKGGKILLVDDDEDTMRFVALQFEKEGLRVESISNPLLILSLIERFNPDLILIDIHMPECSGLELARMLRQHEVYYDLPIMFLTSETDPSARMDAMALGSDDFFNKHLEPTLLVRAVKSRLKRIREFALVKKAAIWSPE